MNDPTFKGADGQFNRALFDQALRNIDLTEAGFVQEQRAAMARLHLAEAIAGDVNVPLAATRGPAPLCQRAPRGVLSSS